MSGVRSVDPPGDTFAEVVPLLEARGGLLLLDEVALLLDARMYGKTPMDLLHKLMQFRKYELELWWSTQHLEYVDKRLRLLTFESYNIFPAPSLPVVPGFMVQVRESLRGQKMGWHYVRRTRERDELYDTLRTVKRAGYYQLEADKRRAPVVR